MTVVLSEYLKLFLNDDYFSGLVIDLQGKSEEVSPLAVQPGLAEFKRFTLPRYEVSALAAGGGAG